MAKIGTLVGQEFLRHADTEKEYFLAQIKELIGNTFPDKTPSYKIEESDISYRISVLNIFDTDKAYRLPNKTTASPQYISFSFTKTKCYDEAEEGKFYEWEKLGKGKGYKPELKYTDYSVSVSLIGNYREYKCKSKFQFTGIADGRDKYWTYSYGTELVDLFDDSVKTMFAKMKGLFTYKVKNPFLHK